ncbi:MAG TPA: PrsW family glutamic-type intramembrane protease [Pyrinomonadaceae bacterium]|jgi:RsiW-degrading membrane proteinase PrsW (M82 family)
MKLRLTINGGSLTGQEFVLETGFLTIGRSETCSVRLDPLTERIASKQHAFIEAKSDGYYITDNQSTNGTLVNGERVDTAKLANGDTIQFGKNGVTAGIRIDAEPVVLSDNTVDRFKQSQAAEYAHAVQNQPVSVQNSLSNLGLGNIQTAVPPTRTAAWKFVVVGVALLLMIALGMVVWLLTSLSIGLIAAVIATIVAFVPAMFYLLPFMFLDRYDPEPFWLFALAFGWGAGVAVFVSFIVNTVITILVAVAANVAGYSPQIGEYAGAIISAPIFEEGSKGLGLLILLIFFRRYFDDVLDGIVFAGVIALGFATVENVLYYGQGLVGGGILGLVLLFFMRGILSPFAHATFTSMTGIGCGIARESHKTFVRIIMPVLGYLGAVTLHMLWNGVAFLGAFVIQGFGFTWVCSDIGLGGEGIGLCSFFISYALLEVPLFVIYVSFTIFIMRRQNKILKEMLAIDIARGLIPEDHGKIATSAFRSSGWLLGGIFNGKIFSRSRYLRAVGKLGLSYWHIQRATAAQGQTGSFQQNPILRNEVLYWRDKV